VLSRGRVYFVGAGPGAADLITLRGKSCLRRADLIIMDALLPSSFLDELGISIEGKVVEWLGADERHKGQDEINRLMGDAACKGRTVVRLKAGDPLVFGRGGEEAEFLSGLGIPCEFVPGISSFTAGPAAASLPLTLRGESRSFAVVSARGAGGEVTLSYPRADNLVVLMGIAVLGEVVERLLADGWSPETPAAVVERATLPWERRIAGSLNQMPVLAQQEQITSPGILVVGPAASLHPALSDKPRILFTGLDPGNFRILGDLIHWPALEVKRKEAGYQLLPEVIRRFKDAAYHWTIFTNRLGVTSLLTALEALGCDGRIFSGTKIAVAGEGVAEKLAEWGLSPDVTVAQPGAGGILKELQREPGSSVLLVQGSHLPRGLAGGLKQQGCDVTFFALDQVTPHPGLGRPLQEHDVIYFVSPAGVRAYRSAYGQRAFEKEIWCLGEETRAEIARGGHVATIVEPRNWRNTTLVTDESR